jgi:hypothetical protein
VNRFEKLSDPQTFRDLLRSILEPVWSLPEWTWAIPPALCLVLVLAGPRLRQFNKPGWPLLSPITQDWVGLPLHWMGIALAVCLSGVMFAIAALANLGNAVDQVISILSSRVVACGWGAATGMSLGLLVRYVLVPGFERADRPADVLGQPPIRARDYDPSRYFRVSKGIFFGLDAGARPLYLPLQVARRHLQIIGQTGSGKGVAAQVLLPQFVAASEAAFVFDPKNDRFLPEVLAGWCAAQGVPFRLIDLRPGQPPQLNLLADITPSDLATLFAAGFDLGDTGGQDRVYRLDDRRAAQAAADLAAHFPDASMPDLLAEAAKVDSVTNARVFWGFFQELAALPVFATRKGLRLADCLEEPGITYVVGSTLDPVVIMAQKMLLLRLLQLLYDRPRDDTQRWVALFVDEFKYLLSAPTINSLGVGRDFNCHVMLAHQSLGDLEACPGIPAPVVTGAVRDNTGLKLTYRPVDDATARWAQDLSGTTRAHVETVQKGLREGHADGSWRDTEVPLIHRNDLYKLPDMSGVLFGAGTPTYVSMRPLRTREPRPLPVAAPPLADGATGAHPKPAATIKDLI